jgi:hypothetical protein
MYVQNKKEIAALEQENANLEAANKEVMNHGLIENVNLQQQALKGIENKAFEAENGQDTKTV